MARIYFLVIGLVVFLLLTPFSALAALDATMTLDKTSINANVGDTFTVGVVVNAGSNQITSADSYVSYDSSALEASSVAKGTYFDTITQDLNSTRVYVGGLIGDPSSYKTGSGTMATITFKALKAGTTTLSFICNSSSSTTSKIVDKGTLNSDLDCSKTNTATVTVSGSGGSTSTATPTPTTASSNNSSTPTATPVPATTTSTSNSTTPTSVLPTSLPVTGSENNMIFWGALGMGLFALGGILKIIMKP